MLIDARIKIFLYVLLLELEFSIDPSVVIEKSVKYVTFTISGLRALPIRRTQLVLLTVLSLDPL